MATQLFLRDSLKSVILADVRVDCRHLLCAYRLVRFLFLSMLFDNERHFPLSFTENPVTLLMFIDCKRGFAFFLASTVIFNVMFSPRISVPYLRVQTCPLLKLSSTGNQTCDFMVSNTSTINNIKPINVSAQQIFFFLFFPSIFFF